MGGKQKFTGRGEIASVGREIEENFSDVCGIRWQTSVVGHRRGEYLFVGFEYVHDDAWYYLSGCCDAKVSGKLDETFEYITQNVVIFKGFVVQFFYYLPST